MSEAAWNAAGLGLPIVMTVANRAIGARSASSRRRGADG
jgi:pyruvate/2-oxoacid:ferredoxin oxidoreductase alpha subunit